MGGKRSVSSVLVEKPVGKRPLGRTRRRWENDIKIDLQLVKKFSAFYGTRKFINVFTTTGHLSLS